MLTPSLEIIQLLSVFAAGMTAPTFANALVLIFGSILTPGPRTVTAALRAMGLTEGVNFSKYHRVLSRGRWLPFAMSQRLLGLLINAFIGEDAPLEFVIDETLERRRGRRIDYKGVYRDAVRSTAGHVVRALGIRWCCVALLVKVPWSERKWGLPVIVVPVLSKKTCERIGKPHRGGIVWEAPTERFDFSNTQKAARVATEPGDPFDGRRGLCGD